MSSRLSNFGAHTTALQVIEGINLHDKVAIVTGASSGIGVETARALAKAGAHVILAVRNEDVGKQVAEGIRSSTKNDMVDVMTVDLASLQSVRNFVQQFKSKQLPLHILINNAGIMAVPKVERTVDGFESQFGTNHLGPFLLTNLLMPILLQNTPSRIVNVSSIANLWGQGILFDDPNFQDESKYEKWLSYAQSKTANILFAKELNRRYADRGVQAFSVHPGAIRTPLQRFMSDEEMKQMGWMDAQGNLTSYDWKTVEEGASTSVLAATAPELDGKGGSYLVDCQISQEVHPSAKDPQNAIKLWALSEALVGQTFNASAP